MRLIERGSFNSAVDTTEVLNMRNFGGHAFDMAFRVL